MTDPMICLAKCFSSWIAIQIVMGFILVWLIIMLGVSGWLSQSDGGSFTSLGKNGTYTNWQNSVCLASPYDYMTPFAFDYTSSKAKFPSSTSTVYCGFPTNNTTFRLVIGVFGFVTVLILFFHTPLSFVARPIFATYAFLFFAVAVLDINATATGESACLSNFGDTSLKAVIDYSGITLVCSQGRFAALCIFDLIISALFFLVYSAWLFCNDRYVRKGLTNDQKSLLASPSTRKAVPTTEV